MAKKIIIFFSFFILYTNLKSLDDEVPNQVKKLYYIDNSQNFIQKKCSEILCENEHGEKLVECIFSHNAQDQREVFAKLPSHKKREFLRKLNLASYEKFLKSYNEHDWKEIFNSLTDYEQSYWPKTIKEQVEAIHKIKTDSEVANDLGNYATTVILSCINPIYLSVGAYSLMYLSTYGTTPIKASFIATAFKEYMETMFEI